MEEFTDRLVNGHLIVDLEAIPYTFEGKDTQIEIVQFQNPDYSLIRELREPLFLKLLTSEFTLISMSNVYKFLDNKHWFSFLNKDTEINPKTTPRETVSYAHVKLDIKPYLSLLREGKAVVQRITGYTIGVLVKIDKEWRYLWIEQNASFVLANDKIHIYDTHTGAILKTIILEAKK